MGGKTFYFGQLGDSSKTFIDYFKSNGARRCDQHKTPAEWMLEVTSVAAGSKGTQDYPAIWASSEEHRDMKAELARMIEMLSQQSVSVNDPDTVRQFAVSFDTQLWVVLTRVFQQYWRPPSYLYSKVDLCLLSVSPNLSQCITNCVKN